MTHKRHKPIFIAGFVIYLCAIVSAQGSSEGLLERALRGRAQIIELSHTLGRSTPTYGGERDSFRYEKLAEVHRDGYAAGAIRVPEHFGTHVDAPGHFLEGKQTVDRIDAKRLIAAAVVIDVRSQVRQKPDYQLTSADIRNWEREGRIPDGAVVLLLTGWDERYGDSDRYRNTDSGGTLHFPGYYEEAI